MASPFATGLPASCLLGAMFAALMLAPNAAFAQSACVVTLRSPDGASGWASAVERIERAVGSLGDGAGDCREIDVVVDAAGATVTFTTSDGRTAVRRIAQPRELEPLVDALVITVPEPAAPSVAPPPIALTFPVEAPLAREAPALDVPRSVNDRGRVLLGAGAGVRRAPGFSPSGVAHIEIAALLGHWELGLVGRWEPDQEPGDDSSVGHLHLSGIGGGAVLGHRVPVGSFVLVFGANAGVFAMQEALVKRSFATEGRRDAHVSESFVDPRLGAYTAVAFPPLSRFRLRAQLDAAFGLVSHVPSNAELVALPRWSLALAIGVETSVLP